MGRRILVARTVGGEHVSALHDAAIDLAMLGHPVFPLGRRSKQPAIPSAHSEGDPLRGRCQGECGKPGHGLYDATTDLERIDRRWTRNPDDNIGVRTGVSFDALDVDEGGLEGLAQLTGPTVDGPTVRTGTGGYHVWVAVTGLGNRTRFIPGCDWRGQGGYVVAPPSVHPNGRPYEWVGDWDINVPLVAPPAVVADALQPKVSNALETSPRVTNRGIRPDSLGPLTGLIRIVLQAPVGQRNSALNWAAYKLGEHIRAGKLDATGGTRALIEAGLAVGLDDREVVATVGSGVRGGTR